MWFPIVLWLVSGIASAGIASEKGFKEKRWFIAFSFIGWIVVANLKSAKEKGISPEEAIARVKKADDIGMALATAYIVLNIVILIVMAS